MNDYYVYAFLDPRDHTPRYIGKGKGGRIGWWRSGWRGDRWINRWLRALKFKGLEPTVFKVMEGLTEAEAFDWEYWLIGHFGRCFGQGDFGTLMNGTDGGDGTSGHIVSVKTRQQLSAAMKLAHNRPEVKARVSAASKLSHNRPEVKARNSAAMKIVGQHKPPKDGKFKGIGRVHQSYTACLTHNGKKDYLGTFPTEIEAARAYNAAVDKYWNGDGWKNRVDNIPVAVERRCKPHE